jgi:REJ domain
MSVQAYGMFLNTTYMFEVLVSSLDGRSSTKSVIVTPLTVGSIRTTVTDTLPVFNPGSKLIIQGTLYSPNSSAVTSRWTVRSPLGEVVAFTALTPTTRNFTSSDVAKRALFPLSIGPGVFYGGTTYSFRLATHPIGVPRLTTYYEILLTANSPPTGGYVVSVPTAGAALQTKFLITSPGWTTDVANFPLSYSFSFRISEFATYLTLASASLKAFTQSTLPAGLRVLNNAIELQGKATDIFFSSADANTSVTVKINDAVNVSKVLTDALTTAFLVGDVDTVFQTVNNVSLFFNCHLLSSSRDECVQIVYVWFHLNGRGVLVSLFFRNLIVLYVYYILHD